MAREVKYLKQVVAHLEKRYGSEKTKAIMAKALKRYDEIVEENRDEPEVYHMHTWWRQRSRRSSRSRACTASFRSSFSI